MSNVSDSMVPSSSQRRPRDAVVALLSPEEGARALVEGLDTLATLAGALAQAHRSPMLHTLEQVLRGAAGGIAGVAPAEEDLPPADLPRWVVCDGGVPIAVDGSDVVVFASTPERAGALARAWARVRGVPGQITARRA